MCVRKRKVHQEKGAEIPAALCDAHGIYRSQRCSAAIARSKF